MEGKFHPSDPESWRKALDSLEGKEVEVIIRIKRAKRSNQANRYYWGVLLEKLSKHTGYKPEELHEMVKYKFLKEPLPMVGFRIQSTSELNTKQYEEFLSKCRMWGSELGCYIEKPNEVDFY